MSGSPSSDRRCRSSPGPIVLRGRVSQAWIDPVGAGLQRLRVAGADLVQWYRHGATSPEAAGQILFPWPNRVRDGRWQTRGVIHQLDVSEPERGTALHGLVRHRRFETLERTADGVVLRTVVCEEPGYPFRVELLVRYRLGSTGLRVRATATNLGEGEAPVALGAHPYLGYGDAPVSEAVLTVPAASVLTVDDRLLPTGSVPVERGGPDPRAGIRVGDVALNHTFTDLTVRDGAIEHDLVLSDGRGVTLRTHPSFAWLQVYTHPAFPGVDGPRPAVAIEPMTAPPDAFNSGHGLRWLTSGEAMTAWWEIRPRQPRGTRG